jgi:GDPmannose 4,6-dehydratase
VTNKNKIFNEKSEFNPKSPYGASKLFAHHITKIYRESYKIFACNGILFNHESPRRGTNFISNKIVKEATLIKKGLSNRLALGNLKAYRDWGHAKDYVQAMWLIMQLDEPDDFVCATGISHSVLYMLEYVFDALNLDYTKYLEIDPRYYRPEEVHCLKGDSTKLKKATGWSPTYSFESMLDEMIDYWKYKNE